MVGSTNAPLPVTRGWRAAALFLTALTLLGTTLALAPIRGETESVRHLELLDTDPDKEAVLNEPPAEIRLWYSEPPQLNGTTVRLVDEAGELMETTQAAADPDDPKQVYIEVTAPLGSGEYRVHWRTIAQDGHAQNGEFDFRVE